MRAGWINERTALFSVAAIVPALVVVLVLITFWSSLIRGVPGLGVTYTLHHYLALYDDPFTYAALLNTAGFTLTTVIVSFLFGLPIAWLAERTDMPGKTLLYVLMVVGLLIPTFFVAMGWTLLAHPRIGFLNRWAEELFGFGGPVVNIASIPGMGFLEGMSLAPLSFVMTAAAFRAMNPALEEAAEAHGLSRTQTLFYVTVPLLFPSLVAAGIYILVIGIAAFDVPAVIGMSNRIYTFSTLIYIKAINPDSMPEYGIPAAVGAMMFAFGMLVTWWYSRFIRSAERYQVVSGRGYKVKPIELGRWRYAGWGFILFYLLLSIGIPLLLLGWASLMPYLQLPSERALHFVSLDNYRHIDWPVMLRGAWNTAILMIVVPTVTIVLSIPIAWVIIRSGSRWRFVYEFLVFLPHAMPAIVFALAALVAALFLLGDAVPIYGTIWLIVVVYIVERITFCSRVVNSSLLQIHKELEEVGYVSGLGLTAVLRQVFVPLILPAILGVWLWIAIISFRELTVAATLYAPNAITLPVAIWNMWSAGGVGLAAAAVLVMLVVLVPLVLLYWQFAHKRLQGL